MTTRSLYGQVRRRIGLRSPGLALRTPLSMFSASRPWVRKSLWSTVPVDGSNGSTPPGTGVLVIPTTMIPMTSYHDAFDVSYVALVLRMSPFLTLTFQLSVVADIATSHETLPAGSK